MASSESPALTLYSRTGCHLCEDMLVDLRAIALASPAGDARRVPRYTVNVVDIDADVRLFERFNVLVPALYLGEQEICHHFLDLVSLTRALDDFQNTAPTNG